MLKFNIKIIIIKLNKYHNLILKIYINLIFIYFEINNFFHEIFYLY